MGAKSDVWSLGCLVYEMCALSPPFLASNPLQLARKIERGSGTKRPCAATATTSSTACAP